MTDSNKESEVVAAGLGDVVDLEYPDLLARKEEIEARLNVIGIGVDQGIAASSTATSTGATGTKGGASGSKRPKSPKQPSLAARRKPKTTKAITSSSNTTTTTTTTTTTDPQHQALVPYSEKIDTHWDYCMKEMMWLAADFQSERKRQLSLGRKISLALRQHFKTRESKKVRELAEAELKRRRWAGKITRELRSGFWTKIDRIVAYKQKLQADEERKKAMNQQLVTLVQQTERYGESVTQDDFYRLSEADDEVSVVEDIGETSSPKKTSHTKRRKHPNLTIEQALAAGSTLGATRRSKTRVTDYSRMHLEDSELYGEATASEGSGSDDESYTPNNENEENWLDDETTLREAEVQELQDRRRRRQQEQHNHSDEDEEMEDDRSFMADPEELRKLREEGEMEIEDVLERLQQEAGAAAEENDGDDDDDDDDTMVESLEEVGDSPATTKRVHFASSAEPDSGDADELDSSSPGAEGAIVEPSVDLDQSGDKPDQADLSADHDSGRRRTRQAARQRVESDNMEESGEEEEEFVPKAGADVDDETTIEAEERLGRDISPEEEISLLEREGEIPIEELRAMYAQALAAGSDGDSEGGGSAAESGDENESTDDDTEGDKQATLGTLLDVEGSDTSDVYEPDETLAVDDETTIEAEEKLGRDMSYEAELELLKRESEMSVEELLAVYSNVDARESEEDNDDDNEPEEPVPSLSTLTTTLKEDDNGDDDEFEPENEPVDDETTMEAEERLGREMSVEDEIALLQKESEIPVEELLSQYKVSEPPEDSSEEDPARATTSKRKVDSSLKRVSKRKRTEASKDEGDVGLTAISTLEASAERAKRTTASRPFLLSPWVQLREYQKVGLNWLVSLQTRRLNGILADEMGLGKTLQTITLLAYLASYKGIWGPHLVIVPTSVIVNWETEVKRFCPALKVLCYYGSAKRRKELRSGWTKTNWYHIVVTSYQLAVQDAFAFKRKKWYYLILDEAQNIKNFQSQRWQTLINFNTQRRLLLTGTPLQNNLMELWSLLHFLMPYIFRSRKEFSYWFSNPMNNIIEGNISRNDDLISRLHGIIRPFVLRRLKNDVETQMPKKYEHIIKCQLSKRQMFLYEEFMARSSTRQSLRKGGNFMAMMNVLMQLRKVCNHPDLFEPRSIVTPFVLEGLHVSVPAIAARALIPQSALGIVSPQMTVPIWCGSCTEPSLTTCVRHDQLASAALRSSAAFPPFQHETEEPEKSDSHVPGLSLLLESIREKAFRDGESKWRFQQNNNSRRCGSPPFPFPSSLIDSVTLTDSALDRNEAELICRGELLSTPLQLLAMRKNQQQRADEMDELMKKFVFCVPKAGAPRPRLHASSVGCDQSEVSMRNLNDMLLEPLEDYFRPFRKAHARLSSFFPDKKLIQFDAGKLQTLSELLHGLKRGGHRALIFTQMSKMLDVLEAFLNLNGHTYLRLDGSTGVDRRQRLMDRFNNDTKVFCFILSTRSGGLGINLTGADTVIFYDSDWNPAMDAQAQDRAHRIGQTREVHIYRLITEHTIEENILIKAQQKRNLDILVMDGGKFDASQTPVPTDQDKIQEAGDVYTKGGLRDILGIGDDADDGEDKPDEVHEKETSGKLSKEQMEMAMASLEDEDDVRALHGAQKEAAEELKEFDETIEIKKDSDQDDDEGDEDGTNKVNPPPVPIVNEDAGASENLQEDQSDVQEDQQKEQKAMEEEFAAWQSKVGLDASAIEASLGAVERYGLHFREEIDPFYSIFAIMEQKRKMEATEIGEEVDIDEIERQKAAEERRAIEEGDLLVTRPRPEDLLRQRNLYERERARLKATKKRRKLTGENWSSKIDAVTKQPFWYNSDTGEASWDKPQILVENEAFELALQKHWIALPLKPLVHVMSFLSPYPERMCCSYVCRQWRFAATDFSFVRHVYPAEMGALLQSGRKFEHNHFRTIAEAISGALPGDTIELGDGHYWVEEPGLNINFPLRFVGDEQDPSHVILELSGSVCWNAKGGWMEGITFRRPKISGVAVARKMLCMNEESKIDMIQCVFDNEGGNETVVTVTGTSRGRWESVVVRGGTNGIVIDAQASLNLVKCSILMNQVHGVVGRNGSTIQLQRCRIEENGGTGVILQGSSRADVIGCHIDLNSQNIESEAGCTLTTSHHATAVMNTIASPL